MTDDKSLTSADGIARLSGSFWTDSYDDPTQPYAIFSAVAEMAKQFGTERDEAVDAVSRQRVHPYRRERWFSVTLLQSQLDTILGSMLPYGETAIYGAQPDGTRYRYGVSDTPFYIFPMPTNLKRCSYITSRIGNTSRCWFVGIDVILDLTRQVFIFKTNPLTDPNVTVSITTSDQAVTLWLCDAEFEHHDVYNQYGFVHGFDPTQDSELQKPAVLAVAEAIITGSNTADFAKMLSVGTGIGLTQAVETVIESTTDASGPFLVTDRAVYRLPIGSEAAYGVGDTIPIDTFVTNDVIIQQFSQPLVPSWFQALGLAPGIISAGFSGDLMLFNDDTITLKVDHTQTPPYVSFDVGSTTAGAKAFFDAIYARFKTAGLSFWDFLQDEYGSNPQTINPLEFFVKHWFRGTLLVVRLSNAALTSPGVVNLHLIRRLVPPNVLLVLLADLQPPTQIFTIGDDNVTQFIGAEIQQAGLTIGTPTATIQYVATNCE